MGRYEKAAKKYTQRLIDAGWEPLEDYVTMTTPRLARCIARGHEHRIRGDSLRDGGPACQACLHIELAEASDRVYADHGLEVLDSYAGRKEPRRVRCVDCRWEGRVWQDSFLQPYAIGCRACSYKKRAEDRIGEWRVDPEECRLEMVEAGYEPVDEFPGVVKPWRSIHLSCGREVAFTYHAFQQGHGGCADCGSERRAKARRMDMRTVQVAFEAVDLELLETEYRNSDTPMLVRCMQGHESMKTYGNASSGSGCSHCAGNVAHTSETVAAEFLDRGKVILVEDYINADTMIEVECVHCGERLEASLSGIRRYPPGVGVCPKCYVREGAGFSVNDPATLYALHHQDLNAVKVGITNSESFRLRQHRRHGWRVLLTIRFKVGFDARQMERQILSLWKEQGIEPELDADEMPQGGHTETVSASRVSPTELLATIRSLRE